MDDEQQCKCPPPGLPAWLGTFADLMSLLMCFFVLLLSFSEMDVLKFKQIAGSMKFAFGVQNRLEVKDIPKGTSIIAQEFRPGRPEPTPIDVIMQQTIDITQQTLNSKRVNQTEQAVINVIPVSLLAVNRQKLRCKITKTLNLKCNSSKHKRCQSRWKPWRKASKSAV